MKWNQLAEAEIRGSRIVVKDAMILLDPDDDSPDWPFVKITPGTYTIEIHLPYDWHCSRLRIRQKNSTPTLGASIGSVSVDHAKAALIDYDLFHSKVREDFDAYEEWTGMDLDDELAIWEQFTI